MEVARVLAERLAATSVTPEITEFAGDSDYVPFIEAGIPTGGAFTGDHEEKTREAGSPLGWTSGRGLRSLLPRIM